MRDSVQFYAKFHAVMCKIGSEKNSKIHSNLSAKLYLKHIPQVSVKKLENVGGVCRAL